MNVVLLRVGIDDGEGEMQGPLFSDQTFEFIPIPDSRIAVSSVDSSIRTYGNSPGRYSPALVDYFPTNRRATMQHIPMHVDPEFETYTYGDPTRPKRGLRRMQPGDLLVFYAGLEGWTNYASAAALYLIGYFEVSRVGYAPEFSSAEIQSIFGANAHVRDPKAFADQYERLLLVKGGPGSRLLTRAVLISEYGLDTAGKPLKILASAMRATFGTFGGKNSLQRSNPRWVPPDFVDSASRFLRSLP
jgi:putative DNA base modification enzyme with NMAD domain